MSAIPATFSLPDDAAIAAWQGHALLTHWAVISATGPDAASFLHGQLSQDTLTLEPGQWRRAAFCSAKGRMLADLLLWRSGPEEILALVGADIAPAVHKRLSMFVLRAKVKLVLQAQARIEGVFGPIPTGEGPSAIGAVQTVQAGPDATTGAIHTLRLDDVRGCPRFLRVALAAQADVAEPTSSSEALSRWCWLEVMSALPRIETATVDQFVPQMVNFETVGGVNFRKGCYPGQEIVARSQYRGTLKRRAWLAHGPAAMQAGQEVFSATDPGQPAGQVVNAAAVPAPGQGYSALVEVKIAAAGPGLSVDSPQGPALTLDTLPYALFDPTE